MNQDIIPLLFNIDGVNIIGKDVITIAGKKLYIDIKYFLLLNNCICLQLQPKINPEMIREILEEDYSDCE